MSRFPWPGKRVFRLIFAVADDPFIVYTSNIFAILDAVIHVPIGISLAVIAAILGGSSAASRLMAKTKP